jgi:hypothetical protein
LTKGYKEGNVNLRRQISRHLKRKVIEDEEILIEQAKNRREFLNNSSIEKIKLFKKV